jgi:DivIVA domain-containing protein
VIVFLALVLVVLAGLVVALVLGRWGGRGEAMVAPTSTSPFEPLPEGRLDADRAREVRFDIGLRGYRMDQVDTVLDRLVLELRSREEELGALRSRAPRAEPADRADRTEPTRQGVRTHQAGGPDPANAAEANAAGATGRADHADPAVER